MSVKKAFGLSLLVFASIHLSYAETVLLKGRLSSPGTELIFNTFVKNSGMVDTQHPPAHYFVVLGSVKNVPPQDVPLVKQALEEGIKNTSKMLLSTVTLTKAEHFGPTVVLLTTGSYSKMNKVFRTRVETVPGASKRKYEFSSSVSRDYAPYIPVGTKEGCCCETTKIINDRLTQDHLIEKQSPLYNHKIEGLEVDVMGDNGVFQPLPPLPADYTPAHHHHKISGAPIVNPGKIVVASTITPSSNPVAGAAASPMPVKS